MPTILSTKKLTEAQKELVLNSGVGLVHFDILKITTQVLDQNLTGDAIIITSKNAIPALHEIEKKKPVFVVGTVTASLLNEFDIKHVANNARDLAEHIINHHSELRFDYLCGDHRRDELPDLLRSKNIELKEQVAYRSAAVSKSFDRTFAAVLCYSPRGVLAFAKANSSKNNLEPSTIAVCIGNTTAATAQDYFKNVIVAKKATVENVLVTAINALKNDQERPVS
ncbi:hypothetical protein BST97_11400 [Nonlabens spongiae]|uniref:Tetrapyrrole biosynthesis uroporphyrinogen III synthase domain-containing protein n=1 Tax=Nonlabens spongiae TaxID=331648 RepID=A0A1W6MLU0_9FLAO|nr:uroporphyrinogen-III synthase [Nonlabens spongiae]ARN78542.1 hypothetical protein BST97_11400 [Nonlabens spongiae]